MGYCEKKIKVSYFHANLECESRLGLPCRKTERVFAVALFWWEKTINFLDCLAVNYIAFLGEEISISMSFTSTWGLQ